MLTFAPDLQKRTTKNMNKISYALGLGIGQQLKSMGISDFNVQDFTKSICDVLSDGELAMTHREAQTLLNEFFDAQAREQAKGAIAEGKAFLEANAKKEGVVTTKSGLQYQVLKEGTGRNPKATDKVRCHYEGTLINGSVFDSSYQRGEPADFRRCQVPLLHPLSPGLWRARCRQQHTALCHAHLRRGTHQGPLTAEPTASIRIHH